ncbi:hypothetical protein A9K55_005678 [Cordyceps militaris]|uniref:Uncharacterized protein n=1 Tax=Cordyceps militaris TaxID=73501 RepID=A0A2H4SBE1_CORMI|nr:hypothetical protein A9K55_005678 [Cordyceps militaris]
MASSQLGRPRTPPNRAREIAASDDSDSEGRSSDDSLKDLSALLSGRRPQAMPRDASQLLTTPYAKRHAAHHISLAVGATTTIPRHRFDLKALAKDARRDTALQASSLRAREPVRDQSAPSTPSGGVPFGDLVRGDNGKDVHKFMRAVQRTDPGHHEMRYCFFWPDFEKDPPSRPPPEALKGAWTLLTKGNQRVREQNLVSGVPFNIASSQGAMPESIFLWVLDEIATVKSPVSRAELCNLVAVCPEQIASLFTPALLKTLWERIGAQDVSMDRGAVSVSKVSEDVYKGRDWGPLIAILSLLKDIASALPCETRKYALQSLLRMAMDRIIISNLDIGNQFEYTIKVLIDTIPAEDWDSFCHDTCAILLSNFSSQCIRINTLLCLPTSSPRAHDMRRRLAVTFLFQDASLARRVPEEVITLQAVIDRLDRPDFRVGPGTEFAELRAAIVMLDMAVDDGSVLAWPHADAEDQFNASVDELAARLSDIWRRINDAGMKLARTEAKSVVEWVQKRVTHTVRTRRKRAKSVFDLPGQERQQKRDLPRQQEFMKNFFKKNMPAPGPTAKQELKSEPQLGPQPEAKPKAEPALKQESRSKAESEEVSEQEEIVMESIVVRGG